MSQLCHCPESKWFQGHLRWVIVKRLGNALGRMCHRARIHQMHLRSLKFNWNCFEWNFRGHQSECYAFPREKQTIEINFKICTLKHMFHASHSIYSILQIAKHIHILMFIYSRVSHTDWPLWGPLRLVVVSFNFVRMSSPQTCLSAEWRMSCCSRCGQ